MDTRTFSLSIDRLAFGGAGVGRHEGKVVFVPRSYPGDSVEVVVEKDHKRYLEARVVRLVGASPLRKEPSECPYLDDCGGCPWMRLEYAPQLEWKRKIIADQFSHIAGMSVAVADTVPSPQVFGYRARVRLKASSPGGRFKIGYCRPRSHDIVEIEGCAIANNNINRMITQVRAFCSINSPYSSFIDTVKFETGFPPGKGRVTINATGVIPSPFLRDLLAESPDVDDLTTVWGDSIRRYGDADLRMDLPNGIKLSYGPGVFSQINPAANIELVEKVAHAASLGNGEKGLDLYCGMGNITFPLAMEGALMTGVEFSRPAVEDAERNKKLLGAAGVSFIQGDANKRARVMAKDGARFATVVLDPPRGGIAGLAKALASLAERRIVYISCYPPALARDAVELADEGFHPVTVEPVDMFPHTSHIESVTLFERSR